MVNHIVAWNVQEQFNEQKKEMIEFVNQLESEDDINFLESHFLSFIS